MKAAATYRGVAVHRSEVPGAPYRWLHEETGGSGSAATLGEVWGQINAHLGPILRVTCGHCDTNWDEPASATIDNVARLMNRVRCPNCASATVSVAPGGQP